MAFTELDMKKVNCFGWQFPRDKDWVKMALEARAHGWKVVQPKKFESCFAANVKDSYPALFAAEFVDLDTDIKWKVEFDNNKKLFKLSILDSDAEVMPEQKAEFFKNDAFKRTAKKAYEYMMRAKELYEEVVESHLRAGELLEVDEPKLEAILDFCKDQQLLRNFRLGKYIK